MAEAAFWGLIGATALVIGAEVAFKFHLSGKIIGLFLAFGVGALISSVSFDLVVPSLEIATVARVSLGLVIGALTFFIGDRLIDRLNANGPRNSNSPEKKISGLGIVLGTALDGIPESAAIGMLLAADGSVSIALLMSIWVSGFPEALGASVSLEKSGVSRRNIRLMWWTIILLCVVSAAIGYAVVSSSSGATGVFIQSFTAGAMLMMIANEMAPKAFALAAKHAGIATTLGFILAVFLSSLE